MVKNQVLKKSNKKYLFLLLLVILLSAIIIFMVIKLASQKEQQEQLTICNPPYIQYADKCCLDKDENLICDKDEKNIIEPAALQMPAITENETSEETTLEIQEEETSDISETPAETTASEPAAEETPEEDTNTAVASGSSGSQFSFGETNCTDTLDNDGDGYYNGGDYDCVGQYCGTDSFGREKEWTWSYLYPSEASLEESHTIPPADGAGRRRYACCAREDNSCVWTSTGISGSCLSYGYIIDGGKYICGNGHDWDLCYVKTEGKVSDDGSARCGFIREEYVWSTE